MEESKVWEGEKPTVSSRQVSRWNALDPTSVHPLDNETQDAGQIIKSIQQSFESIVIKDSADVEVTSTDTQAAINLQVALQATISLVISLSIADSDKAERVTQDLLSRLTSNQVNRQQTYIENSRGVKVTTTDTDVAVNAQVLLQVLIALVAKINIL
ncbi:spore coat protein X [Virgibacillus subterraneus]|uniref:Spore coat protein X n=1 Tax=Virgibacillus subterraneus TaxID=621109 RepID=A0A1H9EFB0_9BACI|nr:spore coat protein [Virgibacillus subterraneus]SEQ24349.1 spore coat protein X [Virgibacillus subterraneus]